MTLALDQVAQVLQLSPEQLWRESLRAYLLRQKRVLQIDIADLQDRYGVASATELAQRIEQGEIYSHPAWEDLIEWENLLAQVTRLSKLEQDID
jgi:hypothetical protein